MEMCVNVFSERGSLVLWFRRMAFSPDGHETLSRVTHCDLAVLQQRGEVRRSSP